MLFVCLILWTTLGGGTVEQINSFVVNPTIVSVEPLEGSPDFQGGIAAMIDIPQFQVDMLPTVEVRGRIPYQVDWYTYYEKAVQRSFVCEAGQGCQDLGALTAELLNQRPGICWPSRNFPEYAYFLEERRRGDPNVDPNRVLDYVMPGYLARINVDSWVFANLAVNLAALNAGGHVGFMRDFRTFLKAYLVQQRMFEVLSKMAHFQMLFKSFNHGNMKDMPLLIQASLEDLRLVISAMPLASPLDDEAWKKFAEHMREDPLNGFTFAINQAAVLFDLWYSQLGEEIKDLILTEEKFPVNCQAFGTEPTMVCQHWASESPKEFEKYFLKYTPYFKDRALICREARDSYLTSIHDILSPIPLASGVQPEKTEDLCVAVHQPSVTEAELLSMKKPEDVSFEGNAPNSYLLATYGFLDVRSRIKLACFWHENPFEKFPVGRDAVWAIRRFSQADPCLFGQRLTEITRNVLREYFSSAASNAHQEGAVLKSQAIFKLARGFALWHARHLFIQIRLKENPRKEEMTTLLRALKIFPMLPEWLLKILTSEEPTKGFDALGNVLFGLSGDCGMFHTKFELLVTQRRLSKDFYEAYKDNISGEVSTKALVFQLEEIYDRVFQGFDKFNQESLPILVEYWGAARSLVAQTAFIDGMGNPAIKAIAMVNRPEAQPRVSDDIQPFLIPFLLIVSAFAVLLCCFIPYLFVVLKQTRQALYEEGGVRPSGTAYALVDL